MRIDGAGSAARAGRRDDRVARAAIAHSRSWHDRGSSYLPSFETAARSFRLEAIAAPVRNDAEIQAIVAMLGREEGGGLVAMPDGFTW